MSRSADRFWAFTRAAAARTATRLRKALLSDASVDEQEAEANRAAAHEFARRAAALRGGMAKVAQLQAYLEGPGQAEGEEARAALSVLWDHAPGDEPAAVRRVIEEDLGAPPERLFASWDDLPMAAASLGQVHAATAHDGSALAVKVQYPAVAEGLRDDLASGRLVRRLAGAELGGGLSDEAVAALRESLLRELDYRAEGESLDRFAAAWAGDARIVIPRRYPSLSSARVLTMERLSGLSIAEASRLDEPARAAVARTLLRFALQTPLVHRLLNADPNPGNYVVLDAEAGRVGFLDFGCTETIGEELATADRDLWLGIVHRDGEELRHAVYRQGLLGGAQVLDTSTFRAWEQRLAAPFLEKGEHRLEAEEVRDLARLTSQLVNARGLSLPPAALLLWRQRLGVLSVMATLRPRLRFRQELCAILDDGKHPVPLANRYP